MPAERAVMLAQQRLELAAVLTTRVALGPVHAAAVPRQPAAGFGVDVFPVPEVKQLALKRGLGLGIRPRAADLAPEYDCHRHGVTVARR